MTKKVPTPCRAPLAMDPPTRVAAVEMGLRLWCVQVPRTHALWEQQVEHRNTHLKMDIVGSRAREKGLKSKALASGGMPPVENRGAS